MNCAYHAERPITGVCSTCGRPICDDCLVSLSGHAYCKACLEARVRRPSREIHGFIRFVLSAFPGLGHLYMGLFQRGMQLMIGAIGGSFILGLLIPAVMGFFIAGMVFFSIFDAREIHLRMQQGLEVEDRGIVETKGVRVDWSNRYVGYALVAIGALALYNTFIDHALALIVSRSVLYTIKSTVRGMTIGGLAIAAGFWLLQRNTHNDTR